MMDDLPRHLPYGSEVDVTSEYILDGVVEVTAEERKSGKRQQMRVDINRLQESVDYSPSEPVGAEAQYTWRGRFLKTAQTSTGKLWIWPPLSVTERRVKSYGEFSMNNQTALRLLCC